MLVRLANKKRVSEQTDHYAVVVRGEMTCGQQGALLHIWKTAAHSLVEHIRPH